MYTWADQLSRVPYHTFGKKGIKGGVGGAFDRAGGRESQWQLNSQKKKVR